MENMKEFGSKILSILLIVSGSVFVCMGVIGIFVPLMPSTVFFLLAGACYVRSSEKLYYWLLHNKYFGNHVTNFMVKKAMPMRAKIVALSMMWLTMGYSALVIIPILSIKLLLLIIGLGVTKYILSMKTLKE